MNVGEGRVHIEVDGAIARITLDRAAARNALTWSMYEQLDAGLARLETEPGVRVAVLRGSNGTFAAGTDIAQFTAFESGADGVAYERRLEAILNRLESLAIPTIAAVEGYATGAGLILAAVCDLRVCTPDARFGMPIARTVGNCLSIANTARLIDGFGSARTKAMLFTAELLSADQARACGFVHEVVEADVLDAHVARLCDRIAAHAPITLAVTKEAVRRVSRASLPDSDDLIERAYGSRDFREGVAAFLAKRPPVWRGN